MTEITPGGAPNRHAAYQQQAAQHFDNPGPSAYGFPQQTFGSVPARASLSVPTFNFSGAGGNGGPEHREIALLPGEDVLFAADFTDSPIFRHIKSGVVVTQKRVIVRHPHYAFWVIKVGHHESASPVDKLSRVTVGKTLSTGNLIKAAVSGSAALFIPALLGMLLPDFLKLLLMFVLFALAGFFLWTARSLALIIGDVGGHLLFVNVEKPEYQDMITAGQLIQRLILGTEPSTRRESSGAPTASPPAAANPAAQARTEAVPSPPQPPTGPPAQTPWPDPSAPPTIWRDQHF